MVARLECVASWSPVHTRSHLREPVRIAESRSWLIMESSYVEFRDTPNRDICVGSRKVLEREVVFVGGGISFLGAWAPAASKPAPQHASV